MADNAALGGAVGAFGGSLVGMMMAQGNYQEIAKLRQEAMKLYGDVSLPTLEKVAKSKVNGVSMDPRYKAASDAALEKLAGIVNAGGMDAQAQEKLNEAKMQAFDVSRGMAGAADASLARRGMMNSGAAVTSAQGAAQAGINRENTGAIHAASDASQRGLEALMGYGKMAEGLGQADLKQKDLAATQDDRINEFNSGLPAKQFQMGMDKARAMVGINDVMAGDQAATAERTQKQATGIGQGGGAILGAAYDEFGNKKKPANNQTDPNADGWYGDDQSGGYNG